MSEDAAVQAVTADIQVQLQNLAAVMASVSATVTTLLGEAQANSGNVSQVTLDALASAQGQLDAAVAAAQAQAADEAAAVPPPVPPTA